MARLAALSALAACLCCGRGERVLASVEDLAALRRPRRSASALLPLIVAPLAGGKVMLPFRAMDENGDGVVDKEEWMLSARDLLDAQGEHSKARRKNLYEYVGSLYEVCDLDLDGMLNEREVEYAEHLATAAHRGLGGTGEPDAADATAAGKRFVGNGGDDLLAKLDSSHDGQASWDDFWSAARSDLLTWGWHESSFEHPAVLDWFETIFARADLTGDGVLNNKELQFASFLVHGLAAREMARAMMAQVDLNGDGRVSRAEIDAASDGAPAVPPGQRSVKTQLALDFDIADADGDGSLDEEEAVALSSHILGMLDADKL